MLRLVHLRLPSSGQIRRKSIDVGSIVSRGSRNRPSSIRWFPTTSRLQFNCFWCLLTNDPALSPDDALGDGRRGNEDRVAGGERQPQHVVFDRLGQLELVRVGQLAPKQFDLVGQRDPVAHQWHHPRAPACRAAASPLRVEESFGKLFFCLPSPSGCGESRFRRWPPGGLALRSAVEAIFGRENVPQLAVVEKDSAAVLALIDVYPCRFRPSHLGQVTRRGQVHQETNARIRPAVQVGSSRASR